jgi:hypothetical protein
MASYVLDTGTPTGSSTYELLNEDYAVEFNLTSIEKITSLAAYVTQGSLQPGANFEFQIYSNTGFLGRNGPGTALDSVIATWTTNGWTSVSTSWTPTATGLYWLVVEPSGTPQGLDLIGEQSTTTGTVPGSGFAIKGSGTNGFTTTGAPAIGVQISAVPLPAAAWLVLSGLAGFGLLGRRKGRSA